MGAFQQPVSPAVNTAQEPPIRPVLTVSRAPSCELRGPLIRIPSRSAGDGVQVRVSPPATARYPEGAPIVVHSSAAPSVDRVNACLSGQGFVARLPRLAVLVFESEVGHVTAAADHPHAIAHVNAWLDAGARWVRFNPDPHYVESVMGKRPARVVQYPAGKGLDRNSIAGLLEPEEANGGLRTRREWPLRSANWPIVHTAAIGRPC